MMTPVKCVGHQMYTPNGGLKGGREASCHFLARLIKPEETNKYWYFYEEIYHWTSKRTSKALIYFKKLLQYKELQKKRSGLADLSIDNCNPHRLTEKAPYAPPGDPYYMGCPTKIFFKFWRTLMNEFESVYSDPKILAALAAARGGSIHDRSGRPESETQKSHCMAMGRSVDGAK